MSASEATHHRRSATGGGGGAPVSDDSDDDQSWHSMSESGNVQRKSCESDCPVEEVDLESGVLELKKVLHLSKVERNCRICHLGLEGGGGTDSGSGVPIDLGCSCKGDLGAALKQCAETWFKIKGDTTCEICGVTAFNISSEQINESNATTATSASVPAAPMSADKYLKNGFLFQKGIRRRSLSEKVNRSSRTCLPRTRLQCCPTSPSASK